MQVAVVTGPGAVEVRDTTAPATGDQQVLVEVASCGLCTLDRRLFSGEQPVYPVVPGHEPAGRVVEVGAEVRDLPGAPAVGDLVTVDLRTRCGTCRSCRRGRSAICRASQSRNLPDGTISMAAGLSEVIAVPAAHAWPVGAAPIEHAAMGEPIACVVHSIRKSGFQAGDHVAVIGGGYMGRLHLALARLGGAASVGLVDVSADRLREADAAGASWTAQPDGAARTGDIHDRHDVVFVTVGMPGSFGLARSMCAVGGSIVLYGAFPKDMTEPIHPNDMHHEETTVVGVHSHEPEDWRTAAGIVAAGSLAADLDALVTARFGLGDALDAFQLAASNPVYRVLVGGP